MIKMTNWTAINGTYADYANQTCLAGHAFPRPVILQKFAEWIFCIAITTAIPGIVGNIMSIIVLSREKHVTTRIICLLALAVADCFVLIFSIPFYLKGISDYTRLLPMHALWPVRLTQAAPVVVPTMSMLVTLATWCLVLVTVDRYIYVCKPLLARRLLPQRTAKLAIAGLMIASIIYNLPRYFEYSLAVWQQENCGKVIELHKSPMARNSIYVIVYGLILNLLFRYLAPALTVLVLNISLIKNVRHNTLVISLTQQVEREFTLQMIGIVSVFLLSSFVSTVYILLELFDYFKWFTMPDGYYIVLSMFANFFLVLNSSVNLIFYYFIGKRFRKSFNNLVCCKRTPTSIHGSENGSCNQSQLLPLTQERETG